MEAENLFRLHLPEIHLSLERGLEVGYLYFKKFLRGAWRDGARLSALRQVDRCEFQTSQSYRRGLA